MTVAQTSIKYIVRAYQLVASPILGTRCRYHPTCSAYIADAVETHGAISGVWLGMRRLVRCHPWSEGGHDPAPTANDQTPATLTNAKVK
ncbi:MAG: membrane protein insertion efficiency factor YidD [Rhodospirillaceae bacterium]|jgi:putative membrane protein insertion efficiency factor|nr:membrane protein insertion efficiency factor YidD [Rhodospirillaceae bacterium]